MMKRYLLLMMLLFTMPAFAGTVTLYVGGWPNGTTRPVRSDGSPIVGDIYVRVYESKAGEPFKLRDAAPWASELHFKLTSVNTREFCWKATTAIDKDKDGTIDEESPATAPACSTYFAEVPTCTAAKPADVTRPGICPDGTKGTWTQTSTFVTADYPTCWGAAPFLPTVAPAGTCLPIPLTAPPVLSVQGR